MYPLHAHDIKFNVDPLTPNQITFCLADTKKNVNFKIPKHVDHIKENGSCSFKVGHRIKIRAKLLLSSIHVQQTCTETLLVENLAFFN